MSYQESLWDKFEFIRQNSQNQRKYYEQFIQIIQERANLEEQYKQGLLKLNTTLQEHMNEEGNFANIISALKSDQANRAMTCDQIISSLQIEVVDKAKEIVEDQNNNAKRVIGEGRKLEKELQNLVQCLEKSKQKYIQGEKNSQGNILISEISDMLSDISYDKKQRNKQRTEQLQKEVQEYESSYRYWVKEFNGFIDGYKKEIGSILTELQKQDEERIDKLQDCVTKCLIFETQQIKSMEYDLNTIIAANNQIDTKKGMEEFIKQNTSEKNPYVGIKFELYRTFSTKSLENMKRFDQSKNMKLLNIYIVEAIKNKELDWDKLEVVKTNKEQVQNKDVPGLLENSQQILQIFQKLFEKQQNADENDIESQKLSQEDIKILSQLTRKNDYMKRVIIRILETYRQIKKNKMRDIPFNSLSNYLILLLDQCISQKDTFTARKIVALSYYFQCSNIYLQQQILSHDIWKFREFWEGMIFESVYEELRLQKLLNFDKQELQNDIVQREKNVIFSQLAIQGQYMLSMGIKKKDAKEMLSKFARYYGITEEIIKEIGLSVDAYIDYDNEGENISLIGENDDQLKKNVQQQLGSFLSLNQSTLRY